MFSFNAFVDVSQTSNQFFFLVLLPKHRGHLFLQRTDNVGMDLHTETYEQVNSISKDLSSPSPVVVFFPGYHLFLIIMSGSDLISALLPSSFFKFTGFLLYSSFQIICRIPPPPRLRPVCPFVHPYSQDIQQLELRSSIMLFWSH